MKPSSKTKLAYTIAEAAAATGLSRWTFHRLVQAGELRCSKIRGRVLILAGELERLLEKGTKNFIATR
jgi:excisionase family DNA binding protein